MKTFVIAQHHGVFLTLNSMIENGIDDIHVIIPGSQVEKYNKMYNENSNNSEYAAFKDYDKAIGSFIKQQTISIQAFIYDDFDIRNTVQSTINAIHLTGCQEIVACVMAGSLVVNDYRDHAKQALQFKELGTCYSRVYQGHSQLSMYHMIGLPQVDRSMDVNFFIVDMSKITTRHLSMNDGQLISDMVKRKQHTVIPREFNGKDDPLIGTAISARQTLAHNLKMQQGYVISMWNKSIKSLDTLKSDEIFGYPFNCYGKYLVGVEKYLPRTTVNKINANSNESTKWTSGLYGCLDIIDV